MAKFSSPPDQLFECRDCPARCCRVPWGIALEADEIDRFLVEPWVRERIDTDSARVLARGVLPMREHDRRLQCVFLDDDALCGLHKQFGHDYIPRACQAFPFGFVRDERGALQAQLSRLCPSIRDNYGNPVRPQLQAKLRQVGGVVERMATAMSTQSQVILSQRQYLQVVAWWDEQLARAGSPAQVLADIYDQMAVLDQALVGPPGKPTDESNDKVDAKALAAALAHARERESEPLVSRARASFHARVLCGYVLGNLCHPARVRHEHRVGARGRLEGVRAAFGKLAWMRERGTVDLLFVPEPVSLARARQIEPFLVGASGSLVSEYLRAVLARRHVFRQPRYLLAVAVDLAMATVVISRFARCRASAAGRDAVEPSDVREGISIAELAMMGHVAAAKEGKTVVNLRVLLLSSRDRLRKLLAGEA